MKERIERDAVAAERHVLLDAVHARDPGRLPREELGGEVAEGCDERRPDQLDLAEEVRLARLDLLGVRVAVARRTALDHVRDVDVGARETDPVQELLEQLARLADEGDAVCVLVKARSLADEHQVGERVTGAEDDLRARGGERAARAAEGLVAVVGQFRRAKRVAHGEESRVASGRASSRSRHRSSRHRRRSSAGRMLR